MWYFVHRGSFCENDFRIKFKHMLSGAEFYLLGFFGRGVAVSKPLRKSTEH